MLLSQFWCAHMTMNISTVYLVTVTTNSRFPPDIILVTLLCYYYRLETLTKLFMESL